jgi:dTDP-4-dehydrorhamnose 3,5-epimerase
VAHPQGKLVWAVTGEVYDVAVDIRPNSPTFGKWIGIHLSEANHLQVYIPPGLAHGFCVLSETADLMYKCTDLYFPEDDCGIVWNDPEIAIAWPITDPILSPKDAALPRLSQVAEARLPR